MRYQSGIQLLLIIIAIAIVIFIVKPEINKISQKQDQLAEFNSAINKADKYNRALQEKVDKANSFPESDLVALNRFLPVSIDPVVVARDLTNIVEVNNMILQDVEIGEVSGQNIELNNSPAAYVRGQAEALQSQNNTIEHGIKRDLITQKFLLKTIGSYESMKGLLRSIESNSYPLTITEISFSSEENAEDSILFSYMIEVQTYALPVE